MTFIALDIGPRMGRPASSRRGAISSCVPERALSALESVFGQMRDAFHHYDLMETHRQT
jgi:hypothetical protein